MSEFWEFYATKTLGVAEAKAKLKKLKMDAVLLDEEDWVYICCKQSERIAGIADAMLHFADHEGSAWRFHVYANGKRVGGGTFGTNVETGTKNQGFDGDLAATAAALGVDAQKLKKTFAVDHRAFTRLVGFTVMPFDPDDVPKGVHLADELD